MQSFSRLKMKCLVLRVTGSTFFFLFAGSIGLAIIREIRTSYRKDSLYAYILGLVICIIMLLYAALLAYQACHFEQSIKGRNGREDENFWKTISQQSDTSPNYVVAPNYILVFTVHLFNLCTLTHGDNIIGCFEDPVYGSIDEPTVCNLYYYDRSFKKMTLSFKGKDAKKCHQLFESICGYFPWIESENYSAFEDRIMTLSGRRGILHMIDQRRYDKRKADIREDEADHAVIALSKETNEKLNFKAVLDRVHKKKDA